VVALCWLRSWVITNDPPTTCTGKHFVGYNGYYYTIWGC